MSMSSMDLDSSSGSKRRCRSSELVGEFAKDESSSPDRLGRGRSSVRLAGEHIITQDTLGYELRLAMGEMQDEIVARLQLLLRSELAGVVATEIRRALPDVVRARLKRTSTIDALNSAEVMSAAGTSEDSKLVAPPPPKNEGGSGSIGGGGGTGSEDRGLLGMLGLGGRPQRSPRELLYMPMLAAEGRYPDQQRKNSGDAEENLLREDCCFATPDEQGSSNGRAAGEARAANYETAYDDHAEAAKVHKVQAQPSGGHSGPCSAWAGRIIKNTYFDVTICSLIVINALVIGAQTEYMALHRSHTSPFIFNVIENAFTAIFSLEIALRLFVHRGTFFAMAGWRWNVFDLLLVGSQLLEGALQNITLLLRDLPQFGVLCVLRVLRLVRILRLVRVLRLVAELRQIVYSLAASLKPFCITFTLLLMSLYIMAVWVTQLLLEYNPDPDNPTADAQAISLYYSSFGRTVLTLFEGVASGLSWDAAVAPLVQEISPWLGLVFPAYFAFTNFAISNVITGVFVQALLDKSQEMKELDALDNIRRLFATVDSDQSGLMTWEEFSANLDNAYMQSLFQDLDIRMSEAQSMFRLIDRRNDGDISLEDFTQGCLHLRGPAKSIDLCLLKQDIQKLSERFMDFQTMYLKSQARSGMARTVS